MILIFSTQDDASTQVVAEWLEYYKAKYCLINELNPIVDIICEIGESTRPRLIFKVENGLQISDEEINVMWYRRGLNFFKFQYLSQAKKKHFNILHKHLKEEYSCLSHYFFFHLREKTIGEYNLSSPNKLFILQRAGELGLKVPVTRIISNPKNAFTEKHINKNITEIINFQYKGHVFYNRTTLQENYVSETFFPSLVQLEIKKYCELRVFFFIDRFFAMGILPESNKILNTDGRDITGTTYLNRFPFELPESIEKKLRRLIKSLHYSTCSIDMLIDVDFNYYFLELNPIGQFNNLSVHCNYQLEHYIANKLIDYAQNETRVNKRDNQLSTACAFNVPYSTCN